MRRHILHSGELVAAWYAEHAGAAIPGSDR
jgi:hypothetical protein